MSTQPPSPRQSIPRGMNPKYDFGISRGMYSGRKESEYTMPNVVIADTEVQLRVPRVNTPQGFDVAGALSMLQQSTNGQEIVKQSFRALAERLCEEHPAIRTDAEILNGTPHIKNTRLSVGKILAKLYVYGNIQSIVDIHEPHLSEEQVKDAIAYAQDFLEIACDPEEAS